MGQAEPGKAAERQVRRHRDAVAEFVLALHAENHSRRQKWLAVDCFDIKAIVFLLSCLLPASAMASCILHQSDSALAFRHLHAGQGLPHPAMKDRAGRNPARPQIIGEQGHRQGGVPRAHLVGNAPPYSPSYLVDTTISGEALDYSQTPVEGGILNFKIWA